VKQRMRTTRTVTAGDVAGLKYLSTLLIKSVKLVHKAHSSEMLNETLQAVEELGLAVRSLAVDGACFTIVVAQQKTLGLFDENDQLYGIIE